MFSIPLQAKISGILFIRTGNRTGEVVVDYAGGFKGYSLSNFLSIAIVQVDEYIIEFIILLVLAILLKAYSL